MKKKNLNTFKWAILLSIVIASCTNGKRDIKDILQETQKDYRIYAIGGGMLTVIPHYATIDKATGKNYNGMGAINADGRLIIPPEYDFVSIGTANENGIIEVQKDGKWGIMDCEGNQITPCEYTSLRSEFKNYLVARKGDKYGIINTQGIIVVPIIYDNINYFYKDTYCFKYNRDKYNYEAVFNVYKNGHHEVINLSRKGGDNNATTHTDIPDDYQSIEENGKRGYINYLGERIPCQYENERDTFSQGLAAVVKDKRIGFIDKTGAVQIPFEFPYSESYFNYFQFGYAKFSEGLCAMIKNDRFGYIDKTGKTVIPFEYTSASFFHNNVAIVGKGSGNDSKYGLIDRNNRVVIPFKYDVIVYQMKEKTLSEPLLSVQKNKKWGVCTLTGECLVECQFDYPISFFEGYGSVSKNGKYGVIDSKGNLVIPIEYELIGLESRDKGLFKAKKNGHYGIVNLDNKVVVPFEYDCRISIEKLKDTDVFAVYPDNKLDILDIEGKSLLK